MKARTNNMVGITDQLDSSNKFSNYQPDKGTIYFSSKNHQKYYNLLIKETETPAKSREVLALFYILSSLIKFRKKPELFLDFAEIKIRPQIFRELLSRQEQALIQLAFYLYTEKNIFNIKIIDLFNNLDQEGASIAVSGMKLRFDLYIY
ncbi:MAG: DUF6075 family protein [Halarsenatibacteraceae bacterium]